VPHSVERRLNSGVTPASSSSQFSIGVTSTAFKGSGVVEHLGGQEF
jgi:hypothetical protein